LRRVTTESIQVGWASIPWRESNGGKEPFCLDELLRKCTVESKIENVQETREMLLCVCVL